jgi:mono/diheme cytochrome c family protein
VLIIRRATVLGAGLLLATSPLLSSGCGSKTMDQPAIHLQRNMYDTQRGDAQESSEFFADGRVMRTPVEGTVARSRSAYSNVTPDPDMLAADSHFYEGKVNGEPAQGLPMPLTRELLERGQQTYNIFCAACHDQAGTGRGLVARRGLAPPPSFLDDRIRAQADGYIFETISNGRASMMGYRHSIPPEDRWAIVGYLRAMQKSSAVPADALTAQERNQIKNLEMPQ